MTVVRLRHGQPGNESSPAGGGTEAEKEKAGAPAPAF